MTATGPPARQPPRPVAEHDGIAARPATPAPERQLDGHVGPLVRPYVMTRGRVAPRRDSLDLITQVAATAPDHRDGRSEHNRILLSPEQQRILRLCASATSVAEIGGHLGLPIAAVRPDADMYDKRVYQERLHGLRAL